MITKVLIQEQINELPEKTKRQLHVILTTIQNIF